MKKLLLIMFTMLIIGASFGQRTQICPPSTPVVGVEQTGDFPASPFFSKEGTISQTDNMITYALPTDGSSSQNSRAPSNYWKAQRTEYLITPAEMAASGFPASTAINSIGYSVMSAGVGALSGTLKIWLMNTTATTYGLGATWTTTGFTQTASIASWSVPITVGTYDVTFSGGSAFTYTGSGLYVAWEFVSTGTAGSTPVGHDCNTSLANGLYGMRSTAVGTTLTASPYRPATRLGTTAYDDNVSVTNIYTTEKTPTGFGTPAAIGVRVNNVTTTAQTFNLTITVKDQATSTTRYTATQAVTALAAGATSVVNFAGWTPTLQENVNITAATSAIAGETWTTNNTITIPANVNANLFGYNYSLTTPGGYGFTYPGTGIFACKYTMHGIGQITGANIFLYNYATNPGTGQILYAVILNSAGTIVTQSAPYTIIAGDLGTNKNFTFSTPGVFTDGEEFYVGLLWPAGTAQMYLLGIKNESPARGTAFYSFPAGGGTPSADGNTVKYCIEAQVSTYTGPLNPVNFAAAAASSSQINLTWGLNNNNNNVLVAWNTTNTFGTPVTGTTYSAGNPITGGGTVLQYGSATSFNHTGLNPNTRYYYKAWSYNGTIYSPGTIANDITPCAETPAPWTQDFELATFPPSCWSASSGSGDWARTTTASGYATGTASAFADFYNTSGATDFALFSLPFNNGTLTAPTLSFDYAYATYQGEVDEMDVYYSTNGGTSFSLLLAMPGGTSGILNTGGSSTALFVPTAAQWATRTISLPSGTNMVAFDAISAYGNSLYLDNVKIIQGLLHDVGVLSLDTRDVYPTGTLPVATVRNFGGSAETFTVNMTIGAYSSTQTVTALGAGLSQLVTFAPLTAPVGDYTATVTTTLAGDLNAANNTASKAIKVMVLNKQVYGYTTFSSTENGPISFNLNNPGTFTRLLNEYPVVTYPSAGGWANNKWYAAIYAAAAPYNLVTFSTTTGVRTVVGDMGVNINAMSYNTVNNTMYGVGFDGTNSNLYTISLTNGLATLVGTVGTQLIINMAINSAGVCYATDLTSDVLGTINLTTPAFNPIGSIGFDANYAQDMEFDCETGELYMAAYGTTGELRWVNKTTGSTLLIGEFEGGAEVTGFAIPCITVTDKILSLTSVYLEGLYTGSGTMHQAMDESGPHFTAPTVDQITVELHNSANYSNLIWSSGLVNLSTSGTATVTVPADKSGSYYITIKHRNSIETVTATAVSFAGSTISYAFDAPAKAFGSNMGTPDPADGRYLIYGGDVNQDGIIDTGDFEGVDNDAFNYAAGYLSTDVNGDGSIDTGDFVSIDNNGFAYIGSILP